ncbi:hypothetical protein SEVCU139_0443 [Staphylococcus lugdunensis VCU139]|nr:hypothetical protein SEVCU139_0443 [Staphylococcus lugdunensis VCU139]
MKKIIQVCTIFIILLLLAACQNDDNSSNHDGKTITVKNTYEFKDKNILMIKEK